MKKQRPFAGLTLGLIFGLSMAILLQQSGVWPLDILTVFLLPALIALIFIMLATTGRVGSSTPLWIAVVIAAAPLVYGLTGLGSINEQGELNGGCQVLAASDLDTTIVTDTSRSDPFVVDPDGGLSWVASSPAPITDHVWDIYVVVGGFEFVVADGGDPNTDLDVDNLGDEPVLSGYVADLGIRSGEQIRGVYEVGGFIDGDGGACDGFGFVEIRAGFLATLIAKIAALIGILALLIFVILLFLKGDGTGVAASSLDTSGSPDSLLSAGTTGTAGGLVAGQDREEDPSETDDDRSDRAT